VGGAVLTALLIDTHVWVWSLTDDRRISERARTAIGQAQTILVSAISFYEIARKVRLGKWPQMLPYVDRLPELLEAQRAVVASLEAADCLAAGVMEWPHRDPFDRFLAASALRRGVPLVSADPVFDAVLSRIW
jgi:PIN domain nuclease of toxin-antitoxin system